ncbi:MAG: transposase [Chloroflexota bacterium]|nr:transposase [Chloroflexota bacterium]MDE2919597.1 transposase [Chloroflexota bacterium]
MSIAVQEHLRLFGDVIDEEMRLNEPGQMVQRVWRELPERFSTIELDQFVVMPNHVHAIILINQSPPPHPRGHPSSVREPLVGTHGHEAPETPAVYAGAPPAARRIALGDVIGAYKSLTTVQYIRGVRNRHWPPFPGRLWQRNYYEHVVRSEESLLKIREYIRYNPRLWTLDPENPLPGDLPVLP